jgi:hypothetical protein
MLWLSNKPIACSLSVWFDAIFKTGKEEVVGRVDDVPISFYKFNPKVVMGIWII